MFASSNSGFHEYIAKTRSPNGHVARAANRSHVDHRSMQHELSQRSQIALRCNGMCSVYG